MKCPHCFRPVDHEALTCYSCGYSIADAEEIFGRNFVRMNRLNDAAHCLRKTDRDEVEEVLEMLEFRFPQLLFCCYLGALDKKMKLNELGFWLLNHAEIAGADFARPNENAVLVLIDVNSKQAGISLGYFMETLLSEEEAYRALLASPPLLLNGSYGMALSGIFRRVGRSLSRAAREMRKPPAPRRAKAKPTLPSLNELEADADNLPTNPIAAATGGGRSLG